MMDERVAVVAPNAGGRSPRLADRVANKKPAASRQKWRCQCVLVSSQPELHSAIVKLGCPSNLHFLSGVRRTCRACSNSNGPSADKLNIEGSNGPWASGKVFVPTIGFGVKERALPMVTARAATTQASRMEALAELSDSFCSEKPLPNSKTFLTRNCPISTALTPGGPPAFDRRKAKRIVVQKTNSVTFTMVSTSGEGLV